MLKKSCLIFVVLLGLFGFVSSAISQGKVYLVIGSDTAIWDGMNTARYTCYYDQSLFTDPARNAYRVMDPAFRANLVDSYGQPMKMTWWMMAGNIFRHATNANVPVPNTMTLYLMQKYHGQNVLANGDELSLHYHTFFWSDYDQDGLYYWNQAKTFLESMDDFEVTLAQFLLEERVFPVSFRSGWHYMDDDWQKYLDERVLPYSLHNDYPAKRTQDPEPIDNIFDWSLAPSDFIPYRPSRENYQLPGDGPGWQVRSASIYKARNNKYMEQVFAAAKTGDDQVVCFWSHLPEADFPEQMQTIDDLAHAAAEKYPEVKFKYCTAIEAMQIYRQSTDQVAPQISFTDEVAGDDVFFSVETDETIFQRQPFVAVKNLNEEYVVLECTQTGQNRWRTIAPVSLASLAKAGVALCDTMGNQAMDFIFYLPDDAFIDNIDAGYSELSGTWSSSAYAAWGTESRVATISATNLPAAEWSLQLGKAGAYNIFVQFPDIAKRADSLNFDIFVDHEIVAAKKLNGLQPAKQWIYLYTIQAGQEGNISIEMRAAGQNQSGKILAADVVKVSALVRSRDINIKEAMINFGAVSVEDTVRYNLEIANVGYEDLHVSRFSAMNKQVLFEHPVPFVIQPMSTISIPLSFVSLEVGAKNDTLLIYSDDLLQPLIKLPVAVEVVPYFQTLDNEDFDEYQEFGVWHTSVANIYGASSRYAFLNQSRLASARFVTKLSKSGRYDIKEIVPQTVNSTDDALYEIVVDGELIASYHVNQNEGSGAWVTIGSLFLPANTDIELWVKDTGRSTSGDVLRTDAVRFSLVDETTRIAEREADDAVNAYRLEQNYPNPFNANTVISYYVPIASPVELAVYNSLGQKIETLVSGDKMPGIYKENFDASNLANGIYFYKIIIGAFTQIRKMILIK
ncbi:MAG: T9SS type A sorting domain-containing protein [Deferribacteres bacterium]|nr:T9SS type A sorting domain-containing protein [Deferribacteres bacterium]